MARLFAKGWSAATSAIVSLFKINRIAYIVYEALESVKCEVMKIRLKRRNATRSKIK